MSTCGVIGIITYPIIGIGPMPGGNVADSWGRARNKILVIKG